MDPSTLSSMPSIVLAMTPFPYFVEADDAVSRAEDMMKAHDVHHLPIQRDGSLIGILSSHELERHQRECTDATRAANTTVGELAFKEACVVDRSMPLDEVLSEMVKRHLDSVLVTKRDKLVGIFSTTDACQALIDLLRAKFPPSGGEAA